MLGPINEFVALYSQFQKFLCHFNCDEGDSKLFPNVRSF
jgi:hypothetical protein